MEQTLRDIKSLDATGIAHDDRHDRLFAVVRKIYGEKRIDFVLDRRDVNGMREHKDSVTIWIDRNARNPAYTLAHEFGHLISTAINDSPTMPPDFPPEGSLTRRIIGELISLWDHGKAHDILREYGFEDDVAAESLERCKSFIEDDLPTFKDLNRKEVSLVLALGCANMITTYRTEEYVARIEAAVESKKMESYALAKIFAHEISEATSPDAALESARKAAAMLTDDPARAVAKHSDIFPETNWYGQRV